MDGNDRRRELPNVLQSGIGVPKHFDLPLSPADSIPPLFSVSNLSVIQGHIAYVPVDVMSFLTQAISSCCL